MGEFENDVKVVITGPPVGLKGFHDMNPDEIARHCRDRLQAVWGLSMYGIPEEIWKFRPWGDRIVVRRTKADEMVGRIHIPEAHQRPNSSGHIILIGPDVDLPDASTPNLRLPTLLDPLALPGRLALFGMYAGTPLRFSSMDDESGPGHQSPFLLMRIKDIWGIVDEEK